MGKIEDFMVYTKLIILMIISFILANNGQTSIPHLLQQAEDFNVLSVLIVASITFVSYEGFQLVINAVNEMDQPEIKIPRAIYTAIILAILIYFVISVGAILAIPFTDIVQNQEYALAAGAGNLMGIWGANLVIAGAMLAACSAISGTMFGASRQMAVIARDGYFPAILARRFNRIPVYSVIAMALLAFVLVLSGSLQVILEFGSVTFLLVSLLMAYANFRIRHKTRSSAFITVISVVGLGVGTVLILYYEFNNKPEQVFFILANYLILTVVAWLYSINKHHQTST